VRAAAGCDQLVQAAAPAVEHPDIPHNVTFRPPREAGPTGWFGSDVSLTRAASSDRQQRPCRVKITFGRHPDYTATPKSLAMPANPDE
jgi:hypothetical protein